MFTRQIHANQQNVGLQTDDAQYVGPKDAAGVARQSRLRAEHRRIPRRSETDFQNGLGD